MKINNYWYLGANMRPVDIRYLERWSLREKVATAEQYDKAAIWHKDTHTPIVVYMSRGRLCVKSRGSHSSKFYSAVCSAIKVGEKRTIVFDTTVGVSWAYRYLHIDRVQWGCRVFTLEDLREIKKMIDDFAKFNGVKL